MDLFLPCIFICHVNYIKIKANNTAKKYLENNMTKQHNSMPDILGSSKFGCPICACFRLGMQFLEAWSFRVTAFQICKDASLKPIKAALFISSIFWNSNILFFDFEILINLFAAIRSLIATSLVEPLTIFILTLFWSCLC